MKTFLIIGAGVTGLSTAYHLCKKKAGRVVILEKDTIGAGSSSRAAGITTGLLWTHTGIEARKIALNLFDEWSDFLPGYHFHNEEGCLNLMGPDGWAGRTPLLSLYDEHNVSYDILNDHEIRNRWPSLNPLEGFTGLWDPRGGFSEPPHYIDGLKSELIRMGADIREGVSVEAILHSNKTVTGVRTTIGDILADSVICSTYAWTDTLLAALDIQLPAKSFVHQRYVTKLLPSPLRIPPVNADDYFGYIRPTFDGKILMGVETPTGLDFPVDRPGFQLTEIPDQWELAEEGRVRMESLLPALNGVEWESAKTGLINFSMDGEPIIGPVSSYEGLFVGLSFHSGGFSYSPVSGFLLAELASKGKTPINIDAFNPNRYTNTTETTAYLKESVPQSKAVRRRH